MASRAKKFQTLARSRVHAGNYVVGLVKDDLSEAIENFATVKGLGRHTVSLVKLQDEVIKLKRRIEAVLKKHGLELTDVAKAVERDRAQRAEAAERERPKQAKAAKRERARRIAHRIYRAQQTQPKRAAPMPKEADHA
jgi:hypothetical protein